jgi:hypothetical protein
MLNAGPFYHKVFKRAIIAFGSLFSNIVIERHGSDGEVAQTIKVPIAQAPKEKWIVRIDSDPNLDQHTYTTLPRLAFEITGVGYDSARKVNKLNRVVCADVNSNMKYSLSPVPYNIDISLYVLTKTQEDAFQIVEQILPFFMPEFTLGVKSLDQMNVVSDIPIILNSVSQQDDYDGDFQTRRFITWTLNFTMKLTLFGPVHDGKVINNVIVDIGNIDQTNLEAYTAFGTSPTGPITEQYIRGIYGSDYQDPVDRDPLDFEDDTAASDQITIEKF